MNVDVIRKLTIKATTEGVAESTAALEGLASAHDDVAKSATATATATAATATVMDSSAKRQLSLGDAFSRVERSVKTAFAEQQRYEKQLKTINDAVAQNSALFERGIAATAMASIKHEQLTGAVEKTTTAQKAFAAASSGVSAQLVALAAGAGPVGVFLAAIPGWGLPAAVALGVVVKALHYMGEEAKRMSELARLLSDSAQTIGISTDQMQALNIVAAASGVQTDKNTLAFERFTAQLNELRKGTGTLFTELMAVDQGLARQLAGTTDVIAAIDLLAAAYANATDQVKKNAIARAAFGRSGFDEGRVLTSIYDAGGLEAYRAGLDKTDILTKAQLDHWRLLGIEIEHATSTAKNNIASIFTSQILEMQKTFADKFLEISRAAKELNDADGGAFFLSIAASLTSMIPGLNLLLQTIAAAKSIKNAVSPPTTKLSESDPFGTFATGGNYGTKGMPQFDLGEMKTWTSFMGSALTIQQQFTLKQLELKAAFDKLSPSAQASAEMIARYGQAMGALNLDALIEKLNLYNSALGASATVEDIVAAKTAVLQKQQQQGAGLSDEQLANSRRLIQSQTDGTYALQGQIDAMKVQGVTFNMSAGNAETYRIVLTKMYENIKNGLPAASGMSQEFLDMAKAAGAAAQALEKIKIDSQIKFDRATAFLSSEDVQIAQQLKGLYPDVAKALNSVEAEGMRTNNTLKQISTLAGDFASGFAKDLLNGVSAMQALQNATNRLRDVLVDMLAKKLMSSLLSSVTSGVVDTGVSTTGSTAAAGIWLTAGTEFNASLIAAATTAAGIMAGVGPAVAVPIVTGSAAAGAEVAAGGVAGGAALEAGGLAAGIMASGPLILLTAAIAAVSMLMGRGNANAQQDAVVQAAKDAWSRMEFEWKKWLGSMTGHEMGSVQQAIAAAFTSMQSFITAYARSNNNQGGQVQIESEAAYLAYEKKTIKAFLASWQEVYDAMMSGMGTDSPFTQAADNVRKLAAQVEGFVSDTALYYQNDAITAAAKQAGQQYLLSLLQTAPAMSAVGKRLQEIHGTASALQQALEDLGMSSVAAAMAINDGVTKAIAALVATFYEDLQAKINAATGKDYLNQIAALIKDIMSLYSDAADLGVDAAKKIEEYWAAALKSIIESSPAVVAAKSELQKAYDRDLKAAQDMITALNDQIKALQDAKKNIADYIDQLQLSQLSSGQLVDEMRRRFDAWSAYIASSSSNQDPSNYASLIQAAKDWLSAMRAEGEALKQTATDLQNTITALQGFSAQLAEFRKSLLPPVSPEQQSAEALKKLQNAYFQFVGIPHNDNADLSHTMGRITTGGSGDSLTQLTNATQEYVTAINAQVTALQTTASTISATITQLQSFSDQIDTFRKGLLPQASLEQQSADALKALQDIVAQVAGGDSSAVGKLSGVAQEYVTAINAQASAAQTTATAISGTITQLQNFATQIDSFRKSLLLDTSVSTLNPTDRLGAARSQFEDIAAKAKGGDQTALGQLTGISKTYLDQARSYFASNADYAKIFDQVNAVLADTQKSIGDQISDAQKQLDATNAQSDAIKSAAAAELTAIQQLIDATATKDQTQVDLLNQQIDEIKSAAIAQLTLIQKQIDATISNDQLQLNALNVLIDYYIKQIDQIAYVIAELQKASDIAGKQITWDEKALTLYQSAIDHLKSIVDGILDVNDSVSSVEDAVNNYRKEYAAAQHEAYLEKEVALYKEKKTASVDYYHEAMNALLATGTDLARELFARILADLGWQQGGLIPRGLAGGGLVGNGIYNVDSVRAGYVGGGNIMLAGGEYVTRATSVNPATFGALDHINRTGSLPANDNGLNARDYAPHFMNLTRVTAQGFNGQTEILAARLDKLTATVERLIDTTRTKADRPPMPGKAHAA